jgi:hypothetical protein
MAICRLSITTILVLALFCTPSAARDYYLDCGAGNDANSGLSADQAWRSLAKVNATTFAPGDSLLLKRGSRCEGMLWPKGSGQEGRPILIGAYGSGALPLINGSGNEAALKLFNQEYWHIENLETTGGDPYGVFVSGDQGRLRHFRLTNLVVRDVTGQVKTKNSGLVVFNSGGGSQSFDDIVIDGVTAYNTTQWAGILVRGARGEQLSDWGPRAANVVIRNSIAHDIFGDGIVMFQVHNGLIEKSAVWRTGLQPTQTIGTPNGIWYWSCSNCVIEWTEGFFVDSPGVDGGVYDVDWGSDNSIIQYNFGHDSMGYCASVFGAGKYTTTNSIVRYNVCVNNGRSPKLARRQGDMYISTWQDGSLDGVEIYNNTFYWNPPINAPVLLIDRADFVGSRPNFFRNNLIISSVPAMAQSFSPLASDNNLFWYTGRRKPQWTFDRQAHAGLEAYRAATGQDKKSLFADPKLTAAMVPRPGSPVIGAAALVSDRGEVDAFGRPLPARAAIGAVEPGARPAPDLRIDLPEYRGRWVLLSFLRPEDASRTQLVFLQAAREQYWDQGLELLVSLPPEAPADLVHDWNLGDIRPVAGIEARVKTFPTTVIVSPEGETVAQWEGFAPPADLGLTLRALVGPPLGSPQVALPLD